MKPNGFLSVLFLFLFLSGFYFVSFAQSEPVLYFCERYDSEKGEINVSDRFTTGYLTVMVKCSYELDLEECFIQFDKWNPDTEEFEYYKKFDYTVEPEMSYIFFRKNDSSDLKFEEPGFYRVYLLDDRDKTVASALIEIIDK
jgi:hypothetical protein